MKILVFDTETTGLPDYKASIHEVDKWPYIIQLSFIYYDLSNNETLYTFNNYINIADNIKISEDSIKIHGITREKISKNNINIDTALNIFNNYLIQADMIVGHNLSFDKKMLLVEFNRNNIAHNFVINGRKKVEYCTMLNTIDLCKIPFTNVTLFKKDKYKYPKLIELYKFLFNSTNEILNLHDAYNDVLVTLKCFIKLYLNKEIEII